MRLGRRTAGAAPTATPDPQRSWAVPPPRTAAEAEAFLEREDFVWYQRFQLAPGVWSPGSHDVEFVLGSADLDDLTGKTVLDIGTANGGAAFEAERRGASRVVAVDIYGPTWFGVDRLTEFLGSAVEYRQGTVYDLDGVLGGDEFDVVLFDGVLYHLRHPLLGLDNVWRAVALGGTVLLETAVCDEEIAGQLPVARFYRKDELGSDGSNWFVPTTSTLLEWCRSAGFESELVRAWPSEAAPTRALVRGLKLSVSPEYVHVSYRHEQPLRGVPGRPERVAAAARGRLADRFPPPALPWTPVYAETHRQFVATALTDEEVLRAFRERRELPESYGVGLDERVVELPWLLANEPRGRVLDAGSALNHAHVLDPCLPLFDALTIVTLEPEPLSFPERRISYVYADLRELPFRDGVFDTVACISTLEHVGMDNALYGSSAPRAADPESEMRRALAELRRVVTPHARLLITVPYGARYDAGGFRQFDEADVGSLLGALNARDVELTVYRYTAEGWRLSDLRDAARSAYRDFLRDPTPVEDLAAAARAVACIRADV